MAESRLKERLEALQFEAKELQNQKEDQDENYRRYKNHKDDPRWRIKPDPTVHIKKADLIDEVGETEDVDPGFQKHALETNSKSQMTSCYVDPDDNYDDYPTLYFGRLDEPVEEGAAVNRTSLVVQPDPLVKVSGGKKSLVNKPEEADDEFEEEEDEYQYDGEEEIGNLKSNPDTKRSSDAKRSSGAQTKNAATASARKKGKKGSKQITGEEIGENSAGSAGQQQPKRASEYTEQRGETTGELSSSNIKKTKQKRKTLKKADSSIAIDELPQLPEDPLALELPPVDPSFWTQDFSVTKGRGNMFEVTNEFDYEDGEGEEDAEDLGSYVSSRGERRQRKFRSQIIREAFWEPNRGKSLQFGSNFDLAEIPSLSTYASMGFMPIPDEIESNFGSQKTGSPSHVSAVASDGTIHMPSSVPNDDLSAARNPN